MNSVLENQIQNYLNEIAGKIPDGYPNKKHILKTMRDNIRNFTEEHPASNFEDIIEEFGTVSEVIDSFIGTLSDADIHAAFQKKQRLKKLLLCVCILLGIGFICLCRYLYFLYDNTAAIIEVIEESQVDTENM